MASWIRRKPHARQTWCSASSEQRGGLNPHCFAWMSFSCFCCCPSSRARECKCRHEPHSCLVFLLALSDDGHRVPTRRVLLRALQSRTLRLRRLRAMGFRSRRCSRVGMRQMLGLGGGGWRVDGTSLNGEQRTGKDAHDCAQRLQT